MNNYKIGWQEIQARANAKKYDWLIGSALVIVMLIAFFITGTLDYSAR